MTTALLAEALYEHWRSSRYELKRQPVFADQATALEPVIDSTVEQAVADAFISAANGARFRVDIGKEGGQEETEYLLLCSHYAPAGDWDEKAQASAPQPLANCDARVAPALDAFRLVMDREGALTSIKPVHMAMIEALTAADAVSIPTRSAMEAAEADSDAFAARRETMLHRLRERYSPVPPSSWSTEPTEASSEPPEDPHFTRFLPGAKEPK
ncbi:hypothetical protein [Arthrobacter sp. UYCo732]|uniref:hypothetical protein n=1 Tax=Arthrobacter sp. UYCo732 TaxID=3156336 RepID=UPI0033995CD7